VDGVGGAAGMGPCAAPGAAGDGPEEELFGACTPLGCLALLKHAGVALRGKEAVVVGASQVSACLLAWSRSPSSLYTRQT
jgi:hypothetical protein